MSPPRSDEADLDGASNLLRAEGRRPLTWRMAVVASMSLHALLGAGLFLGLSHRNDPAPSAPEAIAIQIMTAPASPPTPRHDTAIGPKRVENHPEHVSLAKADIRMPPAPVIRDVTPEVIAPPKLQTAVHPPQPKPAAEESTAPSAVEAPAKTAAAAPVQGASSAAVSKAEQTWEGLVLAQIERKKRFPSEAERAGQQDLVYIDVTVDRRGRVLKAIVERSQHFPALDSAALDAIRRASPLPAPPNSEGGDTITFAVPIEFYINHNSEE